MIGGSALQYSPSIIYIVNTVECITPMNFVAVLVCRPFTDPFYALPVFHRLFG